MSRANMIWRRAWIGIAAGAAAVIGTGAAAHHSYTSFDPRFLTLTGTVKSYEYTSPHIWVQLLVKGPNGAVTEWGIESGSPASMRPMGLTSRLLKAGDRVTAVIHPKRNGAKEGSLVKLTLPNGRTVNTGDLVTLGNQKPPQ